MQLEIATGFYQSDSLPLSAQRCINWLPVIAEQGALNQRALFDVRGAVQKALTGDTITEINRGSQVMDGVPYFINGQRLYSIDRNDVSTDHGFIEGLGRVSIANNGRWLVIVVPGQKSYAFDNTVNILYEITADYFRVSDTVSFKDGYFIFTSSDGTIFFISALNDPLNGSALDFGSAESRPDKIIGTHVNRNELFVAGADTIERFQNIGGFGFPFQRINGGNIQKGVHAANSMVDFDNSWVFLGGDVGELTSVWRVTGGVQKISTSAIDNAIQKFTKDEIADAFAMTYAFGGNFFASFTFTSSRIPSKTFVYDATTSALTGQLTWHERQSGVSDDKWRVNSIVSAYGELLVGDARDGRIGSLQKEVYTEYGEPIFRQKTSKPFTAEQKVAFAGEVKLTMESGTGLINGLDPQIRMDFSDDGARTWSNDFWRSYGKIGEYHSYPCWRRLGRIPHNRVLRFTTTEPVKSTVIRLDASVI